MNLDDFDVEPLSMDNPLIGNMRVRIGLSTESHLHFVSVVNFTLFNMKSDGTLVELE